MRAIETSLPEPNSKVYPSGVALTTFCAPIVPPAPPMFSTNHLGAQALAQWLCNDSRHQIDTTPCWIAHDQINGFGSRPRLSVRCRQADGEGQASKQTALAK